MTLESNLWTKVRPSLHYLDPVRIETSSKDGTPDVNHAKGWIELKVAKRPKLTDTVVDFTHYTPQQRVWHRRRTTAGGRVHVLAQVGDDLFLFRGDVAWELLGNATLDQLKEKASRWWPPGKKWKRELKDAILSDHFDRGRGTF